MVLKMPRYSEFFQPSATKKRLKWTAQNQKERKKKEISINRSIFRNRIYFEIVYNESMIIIKWFIINWTRKQFSIQSHQKINK